MVYSRVTLKNNTNETIDNVALVERFPAGWEIENPNLGRGNIPPGLSANLWRKEHRNLRDDRVEAFGKLYAGKEVTLVVALRATKSRRRRGSLRRPCEAQRIAVKRFRRVPPH